MYHDRILLKDVLPNNMRKEFSLFVSIFISSEIMFLMVEKLYYYFSNTKNTSISLQASINLDVFMERKVFSTQSMVHILVKKCSAVLI